MRDFDSCNVLFATDGLLLSVLTEDVLAERYSVIVIDEAHERTLGTDVLLGMLSRIVPLRRSRYESGASEVPPLKLVIMSATLALEPLLGLFAVKPPVVSIEGRQFPVETHWMRVTPEDLESALEAAVKTVATIQQTLPRGTVLVFVPGKREISFVSQKLRELFSEEVMLLVSLHSGMDPTQQRLAFEPPPEGVRMVIVATNIAECSLTLPNVRYVVDPGYAREQVWGDDGGGGVFATRRISQASAMQRAGRAGRTVGGHVYRLYSQPLFHHHMEQHDVPQSLRLPIDSLIVTLVGMGITAPDKFPLPSPPPRSALDEAQLRLTRLGLLRCEKAPLRLTVLGAKAAELPVDPPAARMLLALGDEASPQQCRLAAAVCAVWSVGHTMWAAETEAKEKNAFVAPGPWKKALAAADILFPVCLIQMMRFGGPSAAAALRRQMGIPATAVDAFFGLATQALNRWRGKGATGGGELEPPSGSELVQLQQALLGALAHNVCRREQGYYVRLMDGATVHLHARQSSTAFREARHAWISCVELQSPNETAKRFAVYPFAINPAWLFHVAVASSEMKAAPLVDYSRIAQETARYDAAADCVMCEASPRFGPLVQALPSLVIPLRDSKGETRKIADIVILTLFFERGSLGVCSAAAGGSSVSCSRSSRGSSAHAAAVAVRSHSPGQSDGLCRCSWRGVQEGRRAPGTGSGGRGHAPVHSGSESHCGQDLVVIGKMKQSSLRCFLCEGVGGFVGGSVVAMEPEEQALRDRAKRTLADPVALALLAYRMERQGCALLLWLYADVEVRAALGVATKPMTLTPSQTLIDLFDKNGRLFTEQDIRSLYRKYFRGTEVLSDQPGERHKSFFVLRRTCSDSVAAGVRHQVKLLRSKSTKGQLETASQYVTQLRRVQAEIWPILAPVLRDFFGERTVGEARLGEGEAGAELASGALVSGSMTDMVLWTVQQGDELGWTSLWLTFRPFGAASEVVATLCDVAEYGVDSLPSYAWYPCKHHAAMNLTVRRNAVKLVLLGQLMQVVSEDSLQDKVTTRMYRMMGQLSNADQSTSDAQLAGLARGWQVRPPLELSVERMIDYWRRAIDNPAPPSALSSNFDVLKCDPARMAEHLTRSDCALLWNVSVEDFQRFCGLAADKGRPEGNIFRLIEKRFDRMVWVVLSMICWSDGTSGLLAYWISVLDELDKLGNWHSLMMLSSVLNHYLVDGMKKSWAQLPPESLRTVQRVSALFYPGNNYREYRTRYKERAHKWATAHLFNGGVGEEKGFFGLAMPLLQRDVIIGCEMPTMFEHLRCINCQKLRVLGESASMFWLARTAAGHFLATSSDASDDELLSNILALPWTDDEDLLLKVSRRGQSHGLPQSMAVSPLRSSVEIKRSKPSDDALAPPPSPGPVPLAAVAAERGQGRAGYLPGMPPPLALSTLAPPESDDYSHSDTIGDDVLPAAAAAVAGPLVVVKNPLIDMIAARPARHARVIAHFKRPVPGVKFAVPPLAQLSPRGTDALSPRTRGMPGAASARQFSSSSGLSELLSPRARKLLANQKVEVQWCEQCAGRRVLEGSSLCGDCVASARGADALTLVICEGKGERRVRVRRTTTFGELQYVLQCEVGDAARDAVWSFAVNNEEKTLTDASDWDLALLRVKNVSELRLTLAAKAPVPIPEGEGGAMAPQPVIPQMKRQNSKWGTLKRGLTLKFAGRSNVDDGVAEEGGGEAGGAAVSIRWCSNCKARKADKDHDVCEDCDRAMRASKAESASLVVLSVQLPNKGEKRVVVEETIPWKEARYVLETVDKGVFSVAGQRIADEDSWRAALRTAVAGVVTVALEKQ